MNKKLSIAKYSFDKLSIFSKLIENNYQLPTAIINVDAEEIKFSKYPNPKFLSMVITTLEKFILTGKPGYFAKVYDYSKNYPKAIDALVRLDNGINNLTANKSVCVDGNLICDIIYKLGDEDVLDAYKLIAFIEGSNRGRGLGFMPAITLEKKDITGIKESIARKITFKYLVCTPVSLGHTEDIGILKSEPIEMYQLLNKLSLKNIYCPENERDISYQITTKGCIGELKTFNRNIRNSDFIPLLIKKIIFENLIDYDAYGYGAMIYNSLSGELILLRPYCIPPIILTILNNFIKLFKPTHPIKKYKLNDNVSVVWVPLHAELSNYFKMKEIKEPCQVNDFTIFEEKLYGEGFFDSSNLLSIKINSVTEGYTGGVIIKKNKRNEPISISVISPFADIWVENNNYEGVYIEKKLLLKILQQKSLPEYLKKYLLEVACFKENEFMFKTYEVPSIINPTEITALISYHFKK